MADPVLEQVRRRIELEGINLIEAATAIGVGVQSLTRHLDGEYVRSDSLAKYRRWLQGGGNQRTQRAASPDRAQAATHKIATPQLMGFTPPSLVPERPRFVVDLFCGCGGMSLGFERFKGGLVYRVAMALDIEEPMVRVFNDNHPSPSKDVPIARRSDITEFMNEAEIHAYYLDHLARTTGDQALASELQVLGTYSLPRIRKRLHELDAQFLEQLFAIRSDPAYTEAVRELGSGPLGQTSVIGFHNATKLPSTGSGYPKMGPLIWHRDGSVPDGIQASDDQLDERLLRACRTRMRKLWDAEVRKLAARADGSGHGQLASAAERITRFRRFLDTKPMVRVRDLWTNWRATREAIRIAFLDDPAVQLRLQAIYDAGHQVSVLLGGPPCQGFSRIGRGKIRSLREQSVHVQEDDDSVDSRNQLMHQYVLFVAALAPEVFLFENVRHFQAVVKSEGIEFDAADILAESIRAVSARGLGYAVARRIVVASKHAVPQARERFVMAGVRKDRDGALSGMDAASWCLSLQVREPVPLQIALESLPEPVYSGRDEATALVSIEPRTATTRPSESAAEVFRSWVSRTTQVDAHVARPPRPDDKAFFALMGPGKRWMDYRCDDAPTLGRLAAALLAVRNAMAHNTELATTIGISEAEIASLCTMVNGSLSLRLLLESIPPEPGELQHHLLTPTYLQKREGAHGDWLSRMDGTQPSKTIVSHMAKDTYAFVHPFAPRTLSVREAARVQSFPDDYRFGSVGLVDGFKVVGNAVPPLLSVQFAERVAQVLALVDASRTALVAQEHRPLGTYS